MKLRADIVRRTVCPLIALPGEVVVTHRNEFLGLALSAIRFIRMPPFVCAWRIRVLYHCTDWIPCGAFVSELDVFEIKAVFEKPPAVSFFEIDFQIKEGTGKAEGEYDMLTTFIAERQLQ